jgi:Tfp pilus assembly PilM family ATPase
MSVAHHIGLEIAEGCFRLVEVQRQDHQTVVLRADIQETSHDYATELLFQLPFNRELAKAFISDMLRVLTRASLFAGGVSIVMPSRLPLVTTLASDASLPEAERERQLEWECKTLLGSDDNTQLSILSHSFNNQSDQQSVLVVAMPRAVVDFFDTTFSHLTLDLEAIDIEHFVMENMVRRRYARDATERYAVLGLFDDLCSIGLYEGTQYKGFRLSAVSYKQQYSAQAFRLLESISAGPIDHVHCFGPGFDQYFAESLAALLNADVRRFLPLPDAAAEDVFREACGSHGLHAFDTAAAAAMQGLQCA